jgi:hypothetical protein
LGFDRRRKFSPESGNRACCSHKVAYRSLGPAANFSLPRLARGEEEATPAKERMTMVALVEGHPNIDVIIFYLLASAILAVTLYQFHRRQV